MVLRLYREAKRANGKGPDETQLCPARRDFRRKPFCLPSNSIGATGNFVSESAAVQQGLLHGGYHG